MAVVKRTNPKTKTTKKAAGKKKEIITKPPAEAGRSGLTLPTEDSEPSSNLGDYPIWIYGRKGVGKTGLIAEMENTIILATEPGTVGLRCRTVRVKDWQTLVGYMDLLCETDNEYKTICVDTVDLMYEYAYDYVCKLEGISDPGEKNDFGMTWRTIRKAVRDQIMRVMNKGLGLVLISHEQCVEVEDREGEKFQKTVPSLTGKMALEIEGLMGVVGNYTYFGEDRALVIGASQHLSAKCRPKYNFLVKGKTPEDENCKVEAIPMGNSTTAACKNLIDAFKNRQTSQNPFKKNLAKEKKGVKISRNRRKA